MYMGDRIRQEQFKKELLGSSSLKLFAPSGKS